MFGLPGAFFSPMFHSPAISARIFLQPGVLPSGPYLGLWLGVSAASPAVAAGILAVFPATLHSLQQWPSSVYPLGFLCCTLSELLLTAPGRSYLQVNYLL